MTRLGAFVLAAVLLVFGGAAVGEDEAPVDPLEPMKAAMAEQDKLVDEGKAESAVTAARERAKDGTPESFYLLGRAIGNLAAKRIEAGSVPEAQGLLDEASENFEKSAEAGGLTFAPAHLGRARVARFRFDLVRGAAEKADEKDRAAARTRAEAELAVAAAEYRQALQITKGFKEAAIELAQVLMQSGRGSDAEYALYQFLAQRPRDADARVLLGLLKLKRKRFAEAEPEFRAVLSADEGFMGARKLLAACLMYQEKFAESAEHWEIVRRAEPKDDEAYRALFHIYRRLKKKDQAIGVLTDLARELKGTEKGHSAEETLRQLAENPAAWDAKDPKSPQSLIEGLDSPDPEIVLHTLEEMRSYSWPHLPGQVYRALLKDTGNPAIRLAALRLITTLSDPQTLTILEILVMHPAERDPDAGVRAEAAHAISKLPSDAIVPVLFEALTDPDADVREWAVQGIAARTGKWFRTDLTVRTADADWAAELKLYMNWWHSGSASTAKRSAALALAELYGRVEKGSKSRVARYALPAMDDSVEVTWRAGYDLFRALTFVTFGGDKGSVEQDERERITREAREWLAEQGKK